MRAKRATRICSAIMVALAACSPGDGSTTGTGGVPESKFTITVGAASIRQGTAAVVPITIVRTFYTGPVFISVTGLPQGVTGPSFTSTSLNLINYNLTADTSAVLGGVQVTVNASGVDVATVAATFALTVLPK